MVYLASPRGSKTLFKGSGFPPPLAVQEGKRQGILAVAAVVYPIFPESRDVAQMAVGRLVLSLASRPQICLETIVRKSTAWLHP